MFYVRLCKYFLGEIIPQYSVTQKQFGATEPGCTKAMSWGVCVCVCSMISMRNKRNRQYK